MKRTGEVILAILGILGYGLLAGLGSLMVFLQNNEEFLSEMESVGGEEVEMAMNAMESGGIMFITASILAILLGIVAIFMVKGNKKPKPAGILFLVTAILVSVVTVGIGLVPGIFYLIAGLMCVVRKPPQESGIESGYTGGGN
ncbi:DUF4064 domain-containing protein [Mesobacillus foraminis]|uniref:DUF4064 domain-containing protein n=1 Tax=Mesobacillus foraminis TaxID=279826 RepID=UPI00399FFF95